MPSKIYGFAGISYCFYSDEEIITTERFADFVRQTADDAVTVNVIRSVLPEKSGKECRIDDRRTVYEKNGIKRLYCSYFEQKDIDFRDFSCREDTPDGYKIHIDFEGPLTDLMLFEALYTPGILAERGILMLHSSFVIYDGRAIVFAGIKQVGKTTQALLWEKYASARMINGDRTALKIENGNLIACGVPFCGSSKFSLDESAQVAAVVFPSIAKKTEIIPRSPDAVFMDIMQLLTYNRQSVEETELASDIAAFISSSGSVYSMPCTPDENTVSQLKQVIFGRK